MTNKEKIVSIKAGDVTLEGLFHDAGLNKGGVVAHPHPLYGGSMYNNVVNAMCSALSKCGYSTLRFNFRGVGGSTGSYGNGEAEQKDYQAAYEFIKSQTQSKESIICSGYSFGAFVAFHFISQLEVNTVCLLISPPLNVMDFSITDAKKNSNVKNSRVFIITGDRDEYCNTENVQEFSNNIKAELTILEGTNHFYRGRENALMEEIKRCFRI